MTRGCVQMRGGKRVQSVARTAHSGCTVQPTCSAERPTEAAVSRRLCHTKQRGATTSQQARVQQHERERSQQAQATHRRLHRATVPSLKPTAHRLRCILAVRRCVQSLFSLCESSSPCCLASSSPRWWSPLPPCRRWWLVRPSTRARTSARSTIASPESKSTRSRWETSSRSGSRRLEPRSEGGCTSSSDERRGMHPAAQCHAASMFACVCECAACRC